MSSSVARKVDYPWTLGTATITANETRVNLGSTTPAGLSITFTSRGRLTEAFLTGPSISHSAVDSVNYIQLKESTTVLAQSSPGTKNAAGEAYPLSGPRYVGTPSAGQHTWYIEFGTFTTGTLTLAASASTPCTLTIREID